MRSDKNMYVLMETPNAPVGPESSFAQRLDHLWRTVHPGDKPYTYEQVSDALTKAGYDISISYLWQLRNGNRDNPSLRHVRGLAHLFEVPAAYFFNDADEERANAQLALLASMHDPRVRNLALRAHGLSETDFVALNAMITSLQAARGDA